MKKLLVILSIFALATTAKAQDNNDCMREESGPYLTSKTGQNWFLSVGGGANVYFGNYDNHEGLSKRIAPTANISLGKWFSPYFGFRTQFAVSKMKGFGIKGVFDGHLYGQPDADGYYKEKFNYWNGHVELMWNLSNSLCKYNEKRFWNLIPYVGAGYARHFNSHESNAEEEYTINGGLLNNFRLGRTVSIFVDLGVMAVNQRFDKYIKSDEFECSASATIGLTFNISKTKTFSRPCKGSDCSILQKRVDRLDDDLNTLDARNKKLQAELNDANKKLAACEKKLTEKPKEVVIEKPTTQEVETLRATFSNINFETGKSTIKSESYSNLDRAAEILKKYPSSKVSLSGYTDNVGNDQSNLKLSQRRADAVKAYLQSKGVTAAITATGYGEANPVATNATAAGRAQNRRTEIAVY